MVKSATLRRIIISSGFILLIAISCTTVNSLKAPNLVKDFAQTIASILFFTSVALMTAIHRKYPSRHDKPEDIGELFCECPYALCRHPLYFLLLLA